MPVPLCSFCSAPLKNIAFGEARCTHCGAMNRLDGPQPVTDKRLHKAQSGSSYSKWVRGIGFVVALGFLASILFFLRTMQNRLFPPPVAEAPLPKYRPADLHALGEPEPEMSPIDPSGLGALEALDPIARLPWFETLARTWSPDARLVALELHGVRALGTLDVGSPAADPYVRYAFASKARADAARRMAKLGAATPATSWNAIEIVLKRGLMRASVINNPSDDREPAPIVFGCGIPQLVDMWRSRGLGAKEAYNLELDDPRGPKPDYVWRSVDDRLPLIGKDCRFRP
jgi:hypothetical protein